MDCHNGVTTIDIWKFYREVARALQFHTIPHKRQLIRAYSIGKIKHILSYGHLEGISGGAAVAVRDSVGHLVQTYTRLKEEGVTGHVSAAVDTACRKALQNAHGIGETEEAIGLRHFRHEISDHDHSGINVTQSIRHCHSVGAGAKTDGRVGRLRCIIVPLVSIRRHTAGNLNHRYGIACILRRRHAFGVAQAVGGCRRRVLPNSSVWNAAERNPHIVISIIR